MTNQELVMSQALGALVEAHRRVDLYIFNIEDPIGEIDDRPLPLGAARELRGLIESALALTRDGARTA